MRKRSKISHIKPRRLIFSSKARTLQDLSRVLRKAKVLEILVFSVSDFKKRPGAVLDRIQRFFKQDRLIVRSSARQEDARQSSNAGVFRSVLDVPRRDTERLKKAVEDVISSYGRKCLGDEVFVQPCVEHLRCAGVVFTADMDTLAPYYIVNFDESGRPDGITSGRSTHTKTYVCFKHSPYPCPFPWLDRLISACREIEDAFEEPCLDIEFALSEKEELYIFQVRPLAAKGIKRKTDLDLDSSLRVVEARISKLFASHHDLLGKRTIFGIMPDWNPAEMIGLRPKQLALSLYKELITDNVWAYQRDNYGYRNLRSHPLLVSFLGSPYIDVRVDFNSFVPKGLTDSTAEKLVNYYLDKLSATPAHHDKVEFEIVHSCFYLDLPERLKELKAHGFDGNEIGHIASSLLEITNDIIDTENGLYIRDLKKIDILKDKFDKVCGAGLSRLEKIYWLMEDCKRYGTLPFAGIARAAFIGVQFLKSFVGTGIMSQQDYDLFMNGSSTITKRMNQDMEAFFHHRISREDFLKQYGHLRPGTYDILSPRYDENFAGYFSGFKPCADQDRVCGFEFSKKQLQEIDAALADNGLKIDAVHLIRFIREAVEGREYAKFIFTRSVSEVLRLVEGLGQEWGIGKKDMAHMNIRVILDQYAVLHNQDIGRILKQEISKNRTLYTYTTAVKFPALIRSVGDLYGFLVEDEEPNFVTLKRSRGHVLEEEQFKGADFKNKVVCVRSADPGYDFLFIKGIAGLITQFGGANSHMAIRCAELGIPAVIGAGEKKYARWASSRCLEIDASAKQVRIIS